MVQRIYASKLLGIADGYDALRTQRLELVAEMRRDHTMAKELAEKYSISVADAYRRLREMREEIKKLGIDGTLRRLANEYDLPVEDVLERFLRVAPRLA